MSLKDSFTEELKNDAALTKKILERVPMDKKDWKPHEKSMTIGRLATHIAEIPHWITDILSADSYDFISRALTPYTASSTEELLKIFSDQVDAALEQLSKSSDNDFDKTWTIKRGDVALSVLPKKIAVRGWGFSHLYHHRGQLTVFLRLLDVPVPGMYGPTADERM
jgi:uncharacterized damage-inducible protein DinB